MPTNSAAKATFKGTNLPVMQESAMRENDARLLRAKIMHVFGVAVRCAIYDNPAPNQTVTANASAKGILGRDDLSASLCTEVLTRKRGPVRPRAASPLFRRPSSNRRRAERDHFVPDP